jgi:hypothetical protein
LTLRSNDIIDAVYPPVSLRINNRAPQRRYHPAFAVSTLLPIGRQNSGSPVGTLRSQPGASRNCRTWSVAGLPDHFSASAAISAGLSVK